ncbi:MAG: hypothetical protein RR752_06400, partial [Mucinivorans sp.]
MKYEVLYLFVLALLLSPVMADCSYAHNTIKKRDTTVISSVDLDPAAIAIEKANKTKIYSDTLLVNGNYPDQVTRSDKFYDTLSKSRSWVARMLASLLVASHKDMDDGQTSTSKLATSRHYFQDFSGCVITQIKVVQANVFARAPGVDPGWAGRFLDNVHM